MLKTIQITDRIYYDPMSNMIILSVDRVTLTLTLKEFIELNKDIKIAMGAITNFISITSGFDKMLNSFNVSDNYINSGSGQQEI